MLGDRLTAQLLAGPPARDPVAVAERLLAIQAQDARGARLAVRVRTVGVSASDIDHALTHERSLLITWLNRGTLHLVRREDYPWLRVLTTPQLLNANARRLAQEGVSHSAADRGVEVVRNALAHEGPLSRGQLRERIDAAGVRTDGQALVHILMLACLRGYALRGPMIGANHCYALVHDWLGDAPAVDRQRALAELSRRFLQGHGPADDRDLAKWAGITLRDARAALSAIAPELEQGPDRTVNLARRGPTAALPPPRLLGPFDPVLLGWRSRAELLGPAERAIIIGGWFRSFALVRGHAAATWRFAAGKVVLEPFEPLARADAGALAVEAAAVERFLA